MDLTRQLSVFGRVQEANLRTIDLHHQLHDIMPFLRGALPSHIDLKMELEETLWTVKVDPLPLELALLNLAINARGACRMAGSLASLDETRPLPIDWPI